MTTKKVSVPASVAEEVHLILAHAGPKRFEHTRWSSHRMRHWVIDVYLAGRQLQRVGHGATFMRQAGVLALYAPGTPYDEHEPAGGRLEEAYVLFAPGRRLDARLRRLTGQAGYCHFEDPGGLATDPLRRLGLTYRAGGRGSDLRVTGLTLEVLGLLESAAAKRLLLQEGLNVQQTAYRLGFSTPFNFSRTFKRVEGFSPRHYVQRHLNPTR